MHLCWIVRNAMVDDGMRVRIVELAEWGVLGG